MLDVANLLGKVFSENEDDSFSRVELEGDEGHGDFTHHVEGINGLWALNLNADSVVETVFLHAHPSVDLPFGLRPSMQPKDVENLLGAPTKLGVEQVVPSLGTYGAWLRFDREHVSIHTEFYLGSQLLKLVTLMLPKVVP